MSKYINADTLEERLEYYKSHSLRDEAYCYDVIIRELKRFAEEDVKPVVHAHWEVREGYYACSNCWQLFTTDLNYCPWCGACMDEKDEEE